MNESINPDRLYSVRETRGFLCIGHVKAYQLINSGRLESVLLGRRTRRITGRSILALINTATSGTKGNSELIQQAA